MFAEHLGEVVSIGESRAIGALALHVEPNTPASNLIRRYLDETGEAFEISV